MHTEIASSHHNSADYLHALLHGLSTRVAQALQLVQGGHVHLVVLVDPQNQLLLENHVGLAILEHHQGLSLPGQVE